MSVSPTTTAPTVPTVPAALTAEAAKQKLLSKETFDPFKDIDAKVNNVARVALSYIYQALASPVNYYLHNRAQNVLQTKINESVNKIKNLIKGANVLVTDRTSISGLAEKYNAILKQPEEAQKSFTELTALVRQKAGDVSPEEFCVYKNATQSIINEALQKADLPKSKCDLAVDYLQGAFAYNMLSAFVSKDIKTISAKDYADVLKWLTALYGPKPGNELDKMLVGRKINAMITGRMQQAFGSEAIQTEIDRIDSEENRAAATDALVAQLNTEYTSLNDELRILRGVGVGDEGEFDNGVDGKAYLGTCHKAYTALKEATTALENVTKDVTTEIGSDPTKISDAKELASFLARLHTATPGLKTKLDVALAAQNEAQVARDGLRKRYEELVGATYGTNSKAEPETGSAMGLIFKARVGAKDLANKEINERITFLNAVKDGTFSASSIAKKIA